MPRDEDCCSRLAAPSEEAAACLLPPPAQGPIVLGLGFLEVLELIPQPLALPFCFARSQGVSGWLPSWWRRRLRLAAIISSTPSPPWQRRLLLPAALISSTISARTDRLLLGHLPHSNGGSMIANIAVHPACIDPLGPAASTVPVWLAWPCKPHHASRGLQLLNLPRPHSAPRACLGPTGHAAQRQPR